MYNSATDSERKLNCTYFNTVYETLTKDYAVYKLVCYELQN